MKMNAQSKEIISKDIEALLSVLKNQGIECEYNPKLATEKFIVCGCHKIRFDDFKLFDTKYNNIDDQIIEK